MWHIILYSEAARARVYFIHVLYVPEEILGIILRVKVRYIYGKIIKVIITNHKYLKSV
jgi:hypothetical protein